MSILDFPTLARATPAAIDWSLVPNTQAFSSPLSGSVQTIERPGARWKASFVMDNLTEADAALLQAFMAQLRGRAGRFRLFNFARPAPRGTLGGAPLVNGAGQIGNALAIDGCAVGATLIAGDYIGCNSELKMVVANAVANGAGQMALTIEPPWRTSPADNAAVTLTKPTAVMMLSNDENKWTTRAPFWTNMPIDCVEAWS